MPTVLSCAKIAKDVYENKQSTVDGFRPVAVPRASVYCNGNHFFAAAYVGAAATGIVSFRGSMELEDWVYADADIAKDRFPSDQLGNAFAFFSAARTALSAQGCRRFLVVGHSLGGGLAAVVAARLHRHPVRGVTFNAPGMAACKYIGAPADEEADTHMLQAAKDAISLAKEGRFIVGAGAAMAASLEGLKKAARHTMEAMEVESKVGLDILPRDSNKRIVFNFRLKNDPVSGMKCNHIGDVYVLESDFDVIRAHFIGSMIEQLKRTAIGGWVL